MASVIFILLARLILLSFAKNTRTLGAICSLMALGFFITFIFYSGDVVSHIVIPLAFLVWLPGFYFLLRTPDELDKLRIQKG